jgi:hypothetical protein
MFTINKVVFSLSFMGLKVKGVPGFYEINGSQGCAQVCHDTSKNWADA